MLIGNIACDEHGYSDSVIKERIGMGEIRDDALGLIQGLEFRDVLLK